MLAKIESSDRHIVYQQITGIDDALIEEMKSKFLLYQKRHVIIADSFDDMRWKLDNEVNTVTINFEKSSQICHFVESKMQLSYDQFILAQKVYVTAVLGSLSIHSIYYNHHIIVKFIDSLSHDIRDFSKYAKYSIALNDFWDILPQNSDYMIAVQEYLSDHSIPSFSHLRRQLAPFKSYFRFQEVLEDYWKTVSNESFIKFFPVWFWWNLTMILPLRVTEFTLISRDCLSCHNGQAYLTIRRTIMKKQPYIIGYSIDADYEQHQYLIPENMRQEIQKYLDLTAELPPSKHDLLFRRADGINLNRATLNSLLCKFYTEAVSQHFMIVSEHDELADDQITPIRLGDTRHLAMISLILQGGNPIICKELAGHEDISISCHYYGNISEFVKCATYEVCRKKHSVRHSPSTFHRKRFSSEFIEIEGGRCYSLNFRNGSCSDCLHGWPQGGTLGNCDCCDYFVPSNEKRLSLNLSEKEQEIDNAFEFLCMIIAQVKKHKMDSSEIARAANQLSAAAVRYQSAYMEVYDG